MMDGWARWQPQALALLRIVTALLLLQHATQKLFGFPIPYPFGPVTAFSLIGLAAAIETVGGLLLLLGWFTRPVAFILSGQMAFAYFIAHARRGFYPLVNGGELAVLFCFVFLYFAAAGAGAWSVDAARRRTSRAADRDSVASV